MPGMAQGQTDWLYLYVFGCGEDILYPTLFNSSSFTLLMNITAYDDGRHNFLSWCAHVVIVVLYEIVRRREIQVGIRN